MSRQVTRTGLTAAALGVATLGLTGCLAGGGTSTSATTAVVSPTTAVAATVLPAAKLARAACQQFRAAIATRDAQTAFAGDFTADAEADQAARLNPQWAPIAAALDTVKSQIQQIDQLQLGSAESNTATDAGTLGQALGTLNGDVTAVATLCASLGLEA